MLTLHHLNKRGKKELLFRCSFHTAFIEEGVLVIPQDELDDWNRQIEPFEGLPFSLQLIFQNERKANNFTLQDEETAMIYLKVRTERDRTNTILFICLLVFRSFPLCSNQSRAFERNSFYLLI